MNERIREFYDNFSERLLADYVHGNPRVEAAIKHALRWISLDARRILDIGCGIGWSTWEIKRNRPHAFVLGVDLSPRAIKIARTLFKADNLHFAVHDVIEDDDLNDLFEVPYDAIVLIDVYEHVPKSARPRFHLLLDKALAPEGRVVLTFPSVLHQKYLQSCQPSGLQPVDEEVTLEDIAELEQDINGKVVHYAHVAIWHTNDYVHTVIERSPKYVETSRCSQQVPSITLEQKNQRARRVVSRLGTRVTKDGILMPNSDNPTICIVSPNKNAYSETFIQAHIKHLPAHVEVLYGDWFPRYSASDDKPIFSPWARRIGAVLERVLRNGKAMAYMERESLRRFLKSKGIVAVLAEYGPTGSHIADVCSKAGVPLIVHFHGFDAYDEPTLAKYGGAYRHMFDIAEAIIAVSRDMEQQLLSLGAPREKLFYNPYGVDTDLFSGADPASVPPVFIAVGRFVDKKAPHLTLLAFREVASRFNEARLVMIGDGELWEACKQMAKALGIAEKVHFLGPRPSEDVAAWMRKSRAFVQHSVRASYGDSEGTPVAILEAGASGLPVVATRHAGIKDVVIDGETGFLVEEGDVDSMAKCMCKLAENSLLAKKLGDAGRRRVCSEFTLERSISNLWRIIDRRACSDLDHASAGMFKEKSSF